MSNFYAQLINWFVPEELTSDTEKRRKAKLLVSACFLLQPFFIITIIKWIKEHQTILVGNIVLAMFLIFACAFILKFTKSHKLATELLISALFFYMTVYNLFSGGINSSSIYWMMSIPLMAVLLHGNKSAMTWASITILQIIVLKIMKTKGMDFNILSYDPAQLVAFKTENFVKQLLAVTLILYIVEKDRLRAKDEQNEAIAKQLESVEEQKKSQGELEKTASQLKIAFERMSSQADLLNSESKKLEESGSNIAGGFQEASGQSRIVSGNTSEINSNLHDVSVSVEKAAQSLQSVLTKVEDASKVADKAVQETKEAEALISDLRQSSIEIGKVTEMIRDISDQTNLLALNATIEAARAGEAGRGFAVVADEIKNLSIKTREATGEIHGRIKVNDDTVGKVVTKNNEIEKIIDTISKMQIYIHENLTSQSETIRNIASITSDSARKSDHIATGAEILVNSVSTVENELEEIVESSKILAEIAEELQRTTRVLDK